MIEPDLEHPDAEADSTHAFFLHADKVVQEALFIVGSLPNAETFSVERALRLLYSIYHILSDLDDPWVTTERLDSLNALDSLEIFRKIFGYLVDIGLLDMENSIQRLCLYVVYRDRIQASLDRTLSSWNLHDMRTEHNQSPIAMYELSREKAINRGYWTGDPGDHLYTASQPSYGQEDGDLPPLDELAEDPEHGDFTPYLSREEEREKGVFVNDDDEIEEVKDFLRADGFRYDADDGNWGIDTYCEAVQRIQAILRRD
ncbi:hypothetical protein GG344DRAFT_56347 [Lentinula edodes]|nr:hypothetical protein GG344DRAFT_56347 [Lentinula edodes]